MSTTRACVLQVLHLQVPPLPTLRTQSACTLITDPSRSLADHAPSAILIRPRLGACTSSLLQSVLPVKGWTSARPQTVENPPNRMNDFTYRQPANIADVDTYHPQPAASRTLYRSHCSHSLPSRLPQHLQPGRSHIILHTDTPSILKQILPIHFCFALALTRCLSRTLHLLLLSIKSLSEFGCDFYRISHGSITAKVGVLITFLDLISSTTAAAV